MKLTRLFLIIQVIVVQAHQHQHAVASIPPFAPIASFPVFNLKNPKDSKEYKDFPVHAVVKAPLQDFHKKRTIGYIMPEWEQVSIILGIVVLVLIGGLVAGLTIGLMSLDDHHLAILKASGTAQEQRMATRIEPIRKNGHLLLVSLLLVNTLVNEALPILFDALEFHGVTAVLSSTVLILIFGEIIPQAVCSHYGLQIGAFFAPAVTVLIYVMMVVAYPVAKLLDYILGHKEGTIYRHAGLKELVALHGEDQAGPLSRDEVSILRAVLDLRSKTVSDVMTLLDKVFMLSINERLDAATILATGYSRIPVFVGTDRHAILGTLLVKQLVGPKNSLMPVRLEEVALRKLPRVCRDTPLFEMLTVFQQGASHMAVVVDDSYLSDGLNGPNGTQENQGTQDQQSQGTQGVNQNQKQKEKGINQMGLGLIDSPFVRGQNPKSRQYICLGVVTLEDVIEELIGGEIIDEAEYDRLAMRDEVSVDVDVDVLQDFDQILQDEKTPLLGQKVKVNGSFKTASQSSSVSVSSVLEPLTRPRASSKKGLGSPLVSVAGKRNPHKAMYAPLDLALGLGVCGDLKRGATNKALEDDGVPELVLSRASLALPENEGGPQ